MERGEVAWSGESGGACPSLMASHLPQDFFFAESVARNETLARTKQPLPPPNQSPAGDPVQTVTARATFTAPDGSSWPSIPL